MVLRTRKHLYTRKTNFSSPVGRRRPVSLTMSGRKQAFRQVSVDNVGLLDNIVRSSTAPGRHGWQRSAPLGRNKFEFPPESSQVSWSSWRPEEINVWRSCEFLCYLMVRVGFSCVFECFCLPVAAKIYWAHFVVLPASVVVLKRSSQVLLFWQSKWGWDSEFFGTVLTSGREFGLVNLKL